MLCYVHTFSHSLKAQVFCKCNQEEDKSPHYSSYALVGPMNIYDTLKVWKQTEKFESESGYESGTSHFKLGLTNALLQKSPKRIEVFL